MSDSPTKSPAGSGCLITVALMTGVIAGIATGQATIGFLAGLGVGVTVAIAFWWTQRQKGG